MTTTDFGFEINSETQRNDSPIANDGFFTNLNLKEFTTMFAIPSTIENELLTAKLLLAMDDVNQKLGGFKSENVALGFNTLLDVPSDQLGGESAKVMQYKQAVYSAAKAALINTSVSLARKAEAENSAATAADLANDYKRMSTNAIARISGRGAIGVHSI